MNKQESANYQATEHLISLEKNLEERYRYTEVNKQIIEAIADAGGYLAVEHLLGLELNIPERFKNTEIHRVLIRAIGRAGRIS